MFESVDALIAEYAELQEKLGDPAVHADAGLSKKLNRRFAELSKIIAAHEKMTALSEIHLRSRTPSPRQDHQSEPSSSRERQ